jgi:uncharacterized membrane protein
MINPWLDSIVLWIHILAGVSWVDGMIFVAGILGPYVRRTVAPVERSQIMAAVGKRFSVLGWSAIFALICTTLSWARASAILPEVCLRLMGPLRNRLTTCRRSDVCGA